MLVERILSLRIPHRLTYFTTMVVMPLYLLYNDIEKKTGFSVLIIILPVLNGFFDSFSQPRKIEVSNISWLRSLCYGLDFVKNRKVDVSIETYVLKNTVFVPQLSFLYNFLYYLIYITGITPKNFTMYYDSVKKTEENNDIEKKKLANQEQVYIIQCRDKLKTSIRNILDRNGLNLLIDVIRSFTNFPITNDHNVSNFLIHFKNELNIVPFDISRDFFTFNEIDGLCDISFMEQMTQT